MPLGRRRRGATAPGDKARGFPVCSRSARASAADPSDSVELRMAARSIASLSLSFGLVSIPVKLHSATESSATVRFNMLDKDGSRLKQQYVSDKAIDPIFYDKAYYLAPDKRGAKPYNLLMQAMRESGRVALAKWAWKAKSYVVQVRPAEDGLVLQQLLYADEVRTMKDLDIEKVEVSPAELKLAMQLIEQISTDSYDPTMFEDEEKKRILAAIDEKIAGRQIVAHAPPEEAAGGAQVIDLVEALRASLGKAAAPAKKAAPAAKAAAPAATPAETASGKERKGVKRAAKVEEAVAPARTRARK